MYFISLGGQKHEINANMRISSCLPTCFPLQLYEIILLCYCCPQVAKTLTTAASPKEDDDFNGKCCFKHKQLQEACEHDLNQKLSV